MSTISEILKVIRKDYIWAEIDFVINDSSDSMHQMDCCLYAWDVAKQPTTLGDTITIEEYASIIKSMIECHHIQFSDIENSDELSFSYEELKELIYE